MPRLFEYIVDAVRRPREQLSRGQHFVRSSWDLAIHCWHQLQRHRAEGMAAELTYRTIFALIPVVVLGLVIFRVFGGLDDVQNKVENQLYSFFGVPEIPAAYMAAADSNRSAAEVESAAPTEASSETDSLVPLVPADGADGAGTTGPPLASEPNASGSNADEPDSGETGSVEIDSSEKAPSEKAPSEKGTSEKETAGTNLGESSSVDDAAVDSGSDSEAEASRHTRASIRRTFSDLTAKVSSIDFASVGVFGLLLFIYAAIALADAVEHLFNRIFEAPTQRPYLLRIAIHWSIITLGSGLLAASLYLSGQVVDWFGTIGAGSNVRWILNHLLAVMASWVLLFLLYALMPNTHVSVRAAAIGAMVGAILWEAAKFGFQVYVAKAVPYSAIYGSIGLIPLFLFWIYVTWLIVLFGLILTYTLQTLRGRNFVRSAWTDHEALAGDPDWMLPIMAEVAAAFRKGKSIDTQKLADRLGLSARVTQEMVAHLVDTQLLRRTTSDSGEDGSLVLAKPADVIEIAEILDLAHRSRRTNHHPAWKMLEELKRAERDAAADKTLADLSAQN